MFLTGAALFLFLITSGAGVGSAAAQTTATFDVVADADTFENAPFLNDGGAEEVHMGSLGSGFDRHTFLRFDLSAIPAGSTVLDASLRVYAFDHGEGDVVTGFFLVLEAWGEFTINWSAEPALASTPDYVYAQNTSESGVGNHTYNVTTLAQSWVDGPNFGMAALNDTAVEQISWAAEDLDVPARRSDLTVVWEEPPRLAPNAIGVLIAIAVVVVAFGFFLLMAKRDRTVEDLLVFLFFVIFFVIGMGVVIGLFAGG